MRPIKFRAWDKKEKRFLSEKEMTEIGGFYYSYGVDPDPEEFELVQFTGLLDRHGKEIWEGNILKVEYVGDEPDTYIGDVVFEDSCWQMNVKKNKNHPEHQSPFSAGDHIEIIGNIYENPELLN